MQNKRLEQMKAQHLVDLLDAYTRSGMQVPDIVCRALVDRRQETEPLLIKLYRGNMFSEAMQVLLINLLSEMNSAEPVRGFCRADRPEQWRGRGCQCRFGSAYGDIMPLHG